MEYFFTEKDGSKTPVALERWAWGVEYTDGTLLHQFDIVSGKFSQVGMIEQDKIKKAYIFNTENYEKRIDIPWVEGMRLIHKYRNIIFNVFTDEERRARVYIFGWKAGEQYTYAFILPDDRIVLSPVESIDLTKFGV